jgi:hypothetical protein
MEHRSYFLMIYGCSLSGKQRLDWSKIVDAARQINDVTPHKNQVHLLGNFDSMRGYLGFPLATSSKRLAHDLDVPIMPSYFALSLDEFISWLNQLVEPDRLRLAETQWSQIRAACRSILSPERPSDVPLGRTLFIRDVDEGQRYGGDVLRLKPL